MFENCQVIISPAWRDVLCTHGLDSINGVYRTGSGQAVTRSGSTEVRRINLGDSKAERIVFVKKYWVNRFSQLWSGMFRGTFFGRSKARREFENLELLRSWGLDAPEPLAYGEERHSRWLVRSFLITSGVPNPLPLDVFIRDRLPLCNRADAAKVRRELVDSLAKATRRLHEHRFVHHDYFWRNIILSNANLDRFWLIDAHKGRRWSRFRQRPSRACDLATLDAPAPRFFSRSDRLRFFLAYLGQKRLDGPARTLLHAVLCQAAPIREKQLQRVRDSGHMTTLAPPAELAGTSLR
jgi:hypothetical protein